MNTSPTLEVAAARRTGQRLARTTAAAQSLTCALVCAGVIWLTAPPVWALAVGAAVAALRTWVAARGSEVQLRAAGVPDPDLAGRVAALADRAGIPAPHVRRLDSSDPSSASLVRSLNACTVDDLSSGATIAVGSHLLGALHRQEEDAVIAHELGHLAHISPGRTLVVAGVRGVWGSAFWVGALSAALGSGPAGIRVLEVVAVTMGNFVLAAVIAATSRADEHAADRTGVAIIGSPVPLASALTRMAQVTPSLLDEHMSAGRRSDPGAAEATEPASPMTVAQVRAAMSGLPGRAWVFSSHPGLGDRVARILAA